MRVSCDVISDLLPLYAEGMATAASEKLVREHLQGCESCRARAESMKAPLPVVTSDDSAMEHVRREISRRRWLAVGCAVLLVLAIACAFLNWLTSPIYLDESVITDVRPGADNTVTVRMDAAAAGVKTFKFELEPTDAGETFVVWTSQWLEMGWREPVPRSLEITRSVTHNGVYLFTGREGEEDLLIYENPQKFINGGIITLPRLFLGSYFLMALGIGVVMLAAAWLFRRERFAKLLARISSMALSYAICQGIICGFTFTSFFAQQEFTWAAVMSFCIWGAGLCGWKMRKT